MSAVPPSVFEVPLVAGTPQTLQVSLAGTVYQLTVKFNNAASVWVIDIDDQVGNPVVHGVPMVTGADLLAQFPYLAIGGALYATTDSDPSDPPTFTNLGQTGHLYFVPAAA